MMSDDKMSDDKNTKNKNSKISDDVETIEVIEADEVVVEANENESIEALEEQLDDMLPPIFSKSNTLGSLVIAAVFGGIVSIAILFGIGYYLVTSSSLGGLNQLLNGADDTNVLEERYTNISTRILALEGEVSLAQTDIENLAEQDGQQWLEAGSNFNSQAMELTAFTSILEELKVKLQSVETKISITELATNKPSITDVSPVNEGQTTEIGRVNLSELTNTQAAVAALASSVAELDAKIASQINVDGQQDAVVAQMKFQVSALGVKVISLKQDIVDSVINTEQLNKNTSVKDTSNMASALAVAALERALQDEKPFSAELDVLSSLVGENVELNQLNAFAASGITSEINLYGQFNELLEAALVADLKGEGKSVLDKFIGNAKSIISIRRTGDIEGDDTEAVLARMEVAVLAKDLQTALAESQGLAGPAQKTFATWIAEVKTRLLAKQLMRQVSGDILKSLQTAN